MPTYFSVEQNYAKRGWRYTDLKTGEVMIEGRAISVDLVKVKSNTPEDWKNATGTKTDVDCRFYEVYIEPGADVEMGIKNLQYFFIRADREMERRRKVAARNPEGMHENAEIGLLVHLPGTAEIYKLKTYLAMISQKGTRYNFLYTYDTEDEKICYPIAPVENDDDKHKRGEVYGQEKGQKKKGSTVRLGKMMPLLHVVADRNSNLPGDIPLADLLDSKVMHGGRQIKLEDREITACFQTEN